MYPDHGRLKSSLTASSGPSCDGGNGAGVGTGFGMGAGSGAGVMTLYSQIEFRLVAYGVRA